MPAEGRAEAHLCKCRDGNTGQAGLEKEWRLWPGRGPLQALRVPFCHAHVGHRAHDGLSGNESGMTKNKQLWRSRDG